MTAKVITVFNQKGGVGKTNVSMQLAGSLARRGNKVLVIDLDKQGTATKWAQQAADDHPFPANVIELSGMGAKAHREIKAHIANYDFIVCDCPPSIGSPAASSAMLVSDLALIPVVPSPPDIWASQEAKELAGQVQVTNEGLTVRLVPTMVQTISNLARDTLEVLLEDDDVTVTTTMLGLRTAYRESPLLGSTVHEANNARKAIDEVESLTDEVLEALEEGGSE